MKHIYLVESGLVDGSRDFIRSFEDEAEAWYFILRRYKKYDLNRKNSFKKEGFRGVLYSKNRWVQVAKILLIESIGKIKKT